MLKMLEDKFSFSAGDTVAGLKMVIFQHFFLTTAWCVESWVSIPDPVHGWLWSVHHSTNRARFCHISTRGDGLRGFVPPPARMSRISWASDPARGQWGTLAAVENHLVPAATPCIRVIKQKTVKKTRRLPFGQTQFKRLFLEKNVSQSAKTNQTVEVSFQRFVCWARNGCIGNVALWDIKLCCVPCGEMVTKLLWV